MTTPTTFYGGGGSEARQSYRDYTLHESNTPAPEVKKKKKKSIFGFGEKTKDAEDAKDADDEAVSDDEAVPSGNMKKSLSSRLSEGFGSLTRKISGVATSAVQSMKTMIADDVLRMMNYETMISEIPANWRSALVSSDPNDPQNDPNKMANGNEPSRDADMAALFYVIHAFYVHTSTPVLRKAYSTFMASVAKTIFLNLTRGNGGTTDEHDTLCFMVPIVTPTPPAAAANPSPAGGPDKSIAPAAAPATPPDPASAPAPATTPAPASEPPANPVAEGGGLSIEYKELVAGLPKETIDSELEKLNTDGISDRMKCLCAFFYATHTWCTRAAADTDVYYAIMNQLHYMVYDTIDVRIAVPRSNNAQYPNFVSSVIIATTDTASTSKRKNPFIINDKASLNKNMYVVTNDVLQETMQKMMNMKVVPPTASDISKPGDTAAVAAAAGDSATAATGVTAATGDTAATGATAATGDTTTGGAPPDYQHGGLALFSKDVQIEFEPFLLQIDGYGETDGKWSSPFVVPTTKQLNRATEATSIDIVQKYVMRCLMMPAKAPSEAKADTQVPAKADSETKSETKSDASAAEAKAETPAEVKPDAPAAAAVAEAKPDSPAPATAEAPAEATTEATTEAKVETPGAAPPQ